MRRSFSAVLATAAALLAGTVSAPAARPSGSLSGEVLGPDEKPVAGARVFLQRSDARNPRTAQTDANGHFHFGSLRHGNYDIRAQAGGLWSEWEHNVLVRAGRPTTLTLRLLLKQPPRQTTPSSSSAARRSP